MSIGTINDTGNGNTLDYVFQPDSVGNQYSPTGRVDFNLSDKHRLSGSYWWQRFTSTTDLLNNAEVRFPGLTNFGTQNSYRTTGNSTLRSTLGVERRQRAARRLAVVAERLLLEHHRRAVRQPGRLRARVPDQHRADVQLERRSRATPRPGASTTPSTGCAARTASRWAAATPAS